ncbi:MAG: 30S ribosomal protein S16 [Legionellales bacterium]|nr:30S ribosomal protein S16 [Legionellales bacterium]
MVVIRLARGGAKKRPFYHIVVANSRSPRDGRNLEVLGYFNPIATGGEKRLVLDLNKVNEWVSKGAQASDRVKTLIAEMKKTQAADVAA